MNMKFNDYLYLALQMRPYPFDKNQEKCSVNTLLSSHSGKNPRKICKKNQNDFPERSYPKKYWAEQHDWYFKWNVK